MGILHCAGFHCTCKDYMNCTVPAGLMRRMRTPAAVHSHLCVPEERMRTFCLPELQRIPPYKVFTFSARTTKWFLHWHPHIKRVIGISWISIQQASSEKLCCDCWHTVATSHRLRKIWPAQVTKAWSLSSVLVSQVILFTPKRSAKATARPLHRSIVIIKYSINIL